ncbi:MAG: hypothetical protein ACK47B_18065 [Armatimonadota bacterium]
MDTKKVGLIAAVVVALVLLAFSFRSTFMNEPAAAGADQAQAMKAAMEKSIQDAKSRGARTGTSGGAAAPQPAPPPGQ